MLKPLKDKKSQGSKSGLSQENEVSPQTFQPHNQFEDVDTQQDIFLKAELNLKQDAFVQVVKPTKTYEPCR